MLKERAELHPDVSAQYYKSGKSDFLQISFKELYQISLDFGAGLLSIGVVREDHVGLISDNRKEWQQADMGIMAIGAIDVPRGCDATEKDLSYIFNIAIYYIITTLYIVFYFAHICNNRLNYTFYFAFRYFSKLFFHGFINFSL